jgi:acyl transferase domain-containing protein
VAGALSLEDGLDLITFRGRLMREYSPPGAMIAVRGDRRTVDAVRAVVPGLDLAVVNGPRDHVLAGSPAAIAEAGDLLNRRGAVATVLPVRHAFHSAHLEPMLPHFHAMAAQVAVRPSRLPLAGTVDGALLPPGTVPSADYFRAQTRGTTRYDRAVATLGAAGCRRFVEIGPGAVLTGLGRRYQPDIPWLPSHCGDDGVGDLLATLARLYCAGVPVDWRPLAAGSGRRIPLPTYPFQRKTYWIDARDARSGG